MVGKLVLIVVSVLIMLLGSCAFGRGGQYASGKLKPSESVILNTIVEYDSAKNVIYDYYKLVNEKKCNSYINLWTEEQKNIIIHQFYIIDETFIDFVNINDIKFIERPELQPDFQEYRVELDVKYSSIPLYLKKKYMSGTKILYIKLKNENGKWKINMIGNTQ